MNKGNHNKKMPSPSATVPAIGVQRPPSHRSAVSLTDIYHTIEKGHSSSKDQSRRRAIKSAQSKALYRIGSGTTSHGNYKDFMSLPSRSRPSSSVLKSRPQTGSRNITETQPDPFGLLQLPSRGREGANSEPGHYYLNTSEADDTEFIPAEVHRPNRSITSLSVPAKFAASRGFCVRSRSALLRETEGLVTSLSRQCCDVLGPRLCHECAIIKRRDRDTRRYESHLPRVEITEENLATTLLIAKAYPDMTLEEIQMKLARGDIQKPVFKFNVQRMQERKLKDKSNAASTALDTWRQKSIINSAATSTFFRSVKDLNKKITMGQMTRKIILTDDPEKDVSDVPPGSSRSDNATFSESVNPSFISGRKGKDEKKRELIFYEPPLLPKVCQNVEPAFFAGKQSAYTLPDKSTEVSERSP